MVGDVVVALGHVTLRPVELVGTTIVTGAVIAMGVLAWHAFPRGTVGRLFARLSAVAVVAPMGFALAYSWALTTHSAHLSYDTIAGVHGSLNALGFVGCGLCAWRLGAKPVGSSQLGWLALDVWVFTVAGGALCGTLSLGLLTMVLFVYSAPVGALLGAALGGPLALVISVVVAILPDPLSEPARFVRGLSVVGCLVALAAGLWVTVAVTVSWAAGTSPWSRPDLLLMVNGLGAAVGIGATGWIAGDQVARRHLQRLGRRLARLPAPPAMVA